MRELITSATLVLIVTILGFMILDSLDSLSHAAVPAPVSAAAARVTKPALDAQMAQLSLRVAYNPEAHFAVAFDPGRWHRLEYLTLATLAHRHLNGCQLELESGGEPVRVSGEWTQTQQLLGKHRFGLGMLTPAGSRFPRQVVYSTLEGNAYMVFTLRIGSMLTGETEFRDCRGDAEAVLATLR